MDMAFQIRPSGAKSFGYTLYTRMCVCVFSRSLPPLTWQTCQCEAGGNTMSFDSVYAQYFYCLNFLPLFGFISSVVGTKRRLLSHYPGNKRVAVD